MKIFIREQRTLLNSSHSLIICRKSRYFFLLFMGIMTYSFIQAQSDFTEIMCINESVTESEIYNFKADVTVSDYAVFESSSSNVINNNLNLLKIEKLKDNHPDVSFYNIHNDFQKRNQTVKLLTKKSIITTSVVKM